ncbi:MAG: hypothetical protein ABIO55_17105 [Ginsengibacter sp.]
MDEQKVELRKIRDFSDNLNDTILFIRQNLKPLLTCFVTIAGAFMLTSAILTGLYQNQWGSLIQDILNRKNTRTTGAVNMFNGSFFLVLIFAWLNYVAMQVVVISYVKVYELKNGKMPLIGEVWDVFKKYFLKVFFYSIPISILTALGFFLCLFPGIYLAVVFVPFFAVLIVEDRPFGEAYSRCLKLIKDNFWISFGIYILTYLIAYFCGGIISLVLGSITGLISYFTTRDIDTTVVLIDAIINIFAFIFYIFYYVAVCMHYFNLSEKYDGIGMMRKLDSIGGNDQDFDNTKEQY